MAKVKILLEKPLTVQIDKEQSVSLEAGLQEVDKAVAEHWYVKAHSQPITDSDLKADQAKATLKAAQTELKAVKEQLTSAEAKIAEQEKLIADLQAKVNATPLSTSNEEADKEPAKESAAKAK
ncbi:MAG: hypothetical protein ACK5LJ_15005 [Paracoccus sp. (in: a-proteobacteria)]